MEETIFLGARHFGSAGHLTLVMLVRIKDSPSFSIGSGATKVLYKVQAISMKGREVTQQTAGRPYFLIIRSLACGVYS
jgi:hypothetical protein